MNARQYIARTALWGLIESHQGNAVLDDGVWDELYELYKGDSRKMAEGAERFLNRIERTLIDMGIPVGDSDLRYLRDKGLEEIAEHREETEEEDEE